MVNETNHSSAHIPKVEKNKPSTFQQFIRYIFYDWVILFANIVVYTFFREVSVRGSFNVPKRGPTIVVVAPHANQFVDGAIILSQIRHIVNRNSPPIIAESSYKQKFIGTLAKLAGAIPVPRAQDNLKFVEGEISIRGDDFKRVFGKGTRFTEFTRKSLIGLPESSGNAEVEEILSDNELVLRKPFKRTDKSEYFLKHGTKFKYAAKISNDDTFQHVFNALHNGGIITIFPEGGSHDRPELLPIKAGFAIMALGAVAADPSKPINIVPTGLNYFHRHKFRSRAVVEFGSPIQVTAENGLHYKENPRAAVAQLLEEVTTALKSVTVTAPDFETLMVIQAARRLYAPQMPLSSVVKMNRQLITGYTHYKDNPTIIKLKESVIQYNRKLNQLGLKDHQVEVAVRNPLESFGVLFIRSLKLLLLFSLSLPGTLLFFPIFIVTDHIAKQKQKAALAGSVVKIKAVDVIATWKITIATIFAPSLYVTYSLTGIYLIKNHGYLGLGSWDSLSLFIMIYLVLVLTTYAAFRVGEAGVDILKSLPPLVYAVFSSGKEITELQETKKELQLEITAVINELGPSVFPKFDDYNRKRKDEGESDVNDQEEMYRGRPKDRGFNSEDVTLPRSASESSVTTQSSLGLSRVNSEGYLSDIPILGDGSYSYYESPTSDYDKVYGSGPMSSAVGNEEAQAKLRKAMSERIRAHVQWGDDDEL